jgi:hypothetical protein
MLSGAQGPGKNMHHSAYTRALENDINRKGLKLMGHVISRERAE